MDNSSILIPASSLLGLVSLPEKICIQNIYSCFLYVYIFNCLYSTCYLSFDLLGLFPVCKSPLPLHPYQCRTFYYNCQKEKQFYCWLITSGCFTRRSPEQLKSVNKATHDASLQTMGSCRKGMCLKEKYRRETYFPFGSLCFSFSLIRSSLNQAQLCRWAALYNQSDTYFRHKMKLFTFV